MGDDVVFGDEVISVLRPDAGLPSVANLRVEHARCDYLEVASELGLPGGILVFGSIFWVLAWTIRQYRQAEEQFDKTVSLGCVGSIVAILVHSLADFNLYIPANAFVFTILLAMAWSSGRSGAATQTGAL